MESEWRLDLSHSGVTFSVRYMLVSKVRGQFRRWNGKLRWNERNPLASSVEVQIDAGSIDTSEPQRDAHVRSADFLDVANHPFITFKSNEVERIDDAKLRVKGTLTMRGVSRAVTLDVEFGGALRDPWGQERIGFTGRATIDRKEFGVNFNQVLDHGGLALGERVDIDIDVEATRPAVVASLAV